MPTSTPAGSPTSCWQPPSPLPLPPGRPATIPWPSAADPMAASSIPGVFTHTIDVPTSAIDVNGHADDLDTPLDAQAVAMGSAAEGHGIVGQAARGEAEVGEGGRQQEVGDPAGVDVGIALDLAGEVAFVVPGPGQQARRGFVSSVPALAWGPISASRATSCPGGRGPGLPGHPRPGPRGARNPCAGAAAPGDLGKASPPGFLRPHQGHQLQLGGPVGFQSHFRLQLPQHQGGAPAEGPLAHMHIPEHVVAHIEQFVSRNAQVALHLAGRRPDRCRHCAGAPPGSGLKIRARNKQLILCWLARIAC